MTISKTFSLIELRNALLYRKIVEWTDDYLILDNGAKVTIECIDRDCCAIAYGEFKDVKLDAAITDVQLENERTEITDDFYGEKTNYVDLIIYHNQNKIAIAECSANNGNAGYYYSVGAVRVKDFDYPIIEC